MKKVWKGAAAAIAALSLGATGFMGVTSAYAAPTEGKASITLNNFDSAHSYKIYQLMTGTVTAKDGKETITDAKWGSDAKISGDVSSTTLDDIAGLESTSAEKANTVIEDYVDTAKGSMFTNDGEYDPGYYVIIDQTETPGKGDSVALPVLVLLHAGETFSINEKHDTVVAIKKVEENTKTIDAPVRMTTLMRVSRIRSTTTTTIPRITTSAIALTTSSSAPFPAITMSMMYTPTSSPIPCRRA